MEKGKKSEKRKFSSREDEISYEIIGAAIEVHKTLGGPGLLESVYEEALAWELQNRGLLVERQVTVPIRYKDQILATPLRVDLLVEKFEHNKNLIYTRAESFPLFLPFQIPDELRETD